MVFQISSAGGRYISWINKYEMGRKKRNCIYEFYKYDDSTKTSQCLICSTILRDKHGGNLMRHFQHKHKEEFKDVIVRNRERRLLMSTEPQTVNSSSLKEVSENIKDSSLAVSSLPDDEAMETLSINDDSEIHGSADEEEVEARRVPAASDPLHTARASDRSTLGSDTDSDEYEVPLMSEVMKQRSRVRRRRCSDVVRKNIAIAEYYEAKKMKVHLEIKKLQLEIDMRMNNRTDATNTKTSNPDTNIKTESI